MASNKSQIQRTRIQRNVQEYQLLLVLIIKTSKRVLISQTQNTSCKKRIWIIQKLGLTLSGDRKITVINVTVINNNINNNK